MITTSEAFKKFKSRLELREAEQRMQAGYRKKSVSTSGIILALKTIFLPAPMGGIRKQGL